MGAAFAFLANPAFWGGVTAVSTVAAAGTGIASSITSQAAANNAENESAKATAKAQKEAEQKTLMETQEEKKSTAARRMLLDIPTSGFGPNKNLARSFLTSL